MSRKIVNTTKFPSNYDILSQTPKNYSNNNYFLKELQDKVNAEWNFRPNRVDIEYEDPWGRQQFSPIEVVIQSVISEKNQRISDDCRNIVFKNIFEDRFSIGSRFRLPKKFSNGSLVTDSQVEENKCIWLATNTDSVKMTSSMIIERCNGTLGSTYLDAKGFSVCHYEPVIFNNVLQSVNTFYNETAASPQAQLEVTMQHNDFTRNYFVNQRFIIGYDKVYKIKAINKFYSNSTFAPEEIGLMKIYMEVTEESPYDNFETRIAYQSVPEQIPDISPSPDPEQQEDEKYDIYFLQPETIPQYLDEEPVVFAPILRKNGVAIDVQPDFGFTYVLQGLPTNIDPLTYLEFTQENNFFTLRRKRTYLRGDLELKWSISAEDSPSGEEMSISFNLSLRD